MKFNSKNSFKSLDTISSSGKDYKIFNLKNAEKNGLEGISKEGAGFLTILDRIIKLVFYYGHERVWFSSNFGVKK